MKRIRLFILIAAAFMLLFSVSVSAKNYRYIETNSYIVAADTTGHVMLPTDGINWRSDLKLAIQYPKAALDQGLQGEVEVICTVDKNGNVSDVKILKDIGGGAGDAVAEAVRKMKFNIAEQNGVTTSYTMAIPVIFTIDYEGS